MKLNLWTLKLEVHIIFTSPKIIPLLILSNYLKFKNQISWTKAGSRPGVVCGCNLPTPAKLSEKAGYWMVFTQKKISTHKQKAGNKSMKGSRTVMLRLWLILFPLFFWWFLMLLVAIFYFNDGNNRAFTLQGLDCHLFLLSNSSRLECECLSHHWVWKNMTGLLSQAHGWGGILNVTHSWLGRSIGLRLSTWTDHGMS